MAMSSNSIIAAALLCCLIAYARHEAQAERDWQEVCDKVQATIPTRGGQ